MPEIKPMKLFIPGIFLLVLGLGNIIVGEFKASQYEDVRKELLNTIEHKSPQVLENVSPLRRIQLANLAQERGTQKLKSTEQRVAFYSLVSTGGAIFVMASIILLIIGFVLQLRNHKTAS